MDRNSNRITKRAPLDLGVKDVAPGEAGSIEQQLDMVEKGPLRGDNLLHTRGATRRDDLEANYNFDMAEWNREGDEMSGDDHSSGLQGGGAERTNVREHVGEIPGIESEDSNDDFDQVDKNNVDAA